MKHLFDDRDKNLRNFRSVDRTKPTFGRTALYLLLLLFIGGVAIDSWFNHHPRQSWRSPTEQPSSLDPGSRKPLL